MVIDGTQVKVVAWYDNEWGYSSRLVELAQRVLVPVPTLASSISPERTAPRFVRGAAVRSASSDCAAERIREYRDGLRLFRSHWARNAIISAVSPQRECGVLRMEAMRAERRLALTDESAN